MGDDGAAQGLVLCVGVNPSDGLDIAQVINGRAVVVMVSDLTAARDALERTDAPAVRRDTHAAHTVTSGPLALDIDCHVAIWQGQEFELHGLEFDLMTAFVTDPGRVWTFEDLTSQVWSHSYLGDPSAVSSAVKRLRRRLREQGVSVEIESVRGLGFRLAVLPAQRRHNGHEHAPTEQRSTPR